MHSAPRLSEQDGGSTDCGDACSGAMHSDHDGHLRQVACSKPSADGVITFPLFPMAVRIGYGVMGLCIAAASLFVYAEQQRVPVLGLVLGGFSVFVLCYVDRWRFICTAAVAEYTVGFFFFSVTKRYAFSDIEGTETEQFTRGLFKTAFVKGILCLRTGEKKTVVIFPTRNKVLMQRWQALAKVLAG